MPETLTPLQLPNAIIRKEGRNHVEAAENGICVHFDGYTTMWYGYIVVFIESVAFSRRLRALTGVDDSFTLRGIQNELIELPSRGDLVPGLGGIRKARFGHSRRGKGKRGGPRE
jgi:hypothetical protein